MSSAWKKAIILDPENKKGDSKDMDKAVNNDTDSSEMMKNEMTDSKKISKTTQESLSPSLSEENIIGVLGV